MDVTTLSFSQFAELLGIDDPKQIAGIGTNHASQMVTIFLLPENAHAASAVLHTTPLKEYATSRYIPKDAHADNRHIASAERQREPAATAKTER